MMNDNDIAVVGMAGRFPGAPDIEAFWKNLRDGVESIMFFSEEELLQAGVPAELIHRPNYVRAKGALADVGMFDTAFFGFSPHEAELLDVQHRVFLECTWEAVEHAGYDLSTADFPVGLYAGVGVSSYLFNNVYPTLTGGQQTADMYQVMLGNDKDFLPTRVAYKLNLQGAVLAVQTACSTSLVAIHLACQSLLSGENDMALAGGVTISMPEKSGYFYQEGMILSPDGHCRAFDAQAAGTVAGNGAGVVVLKRLADAVADGDFIWALVKGSAVNNDGRNKIGYTAPSQQGQAAVISEALALADLEPADISYVETHGTGTVLGDPIEFAALSDVFGTVGAGGFEDGRKRCFLGAVKTNIGHLDAAAGVAGFIKTVLALHHQQIPPTLHYKRPNPTIDFANSPFEVNVALTDWTCVDGRPRYAGVSSFGIGGTNAHVVLGEGPKDDGRSGQGRMVDGALSTGGYLLPLSARSRAALGQASENLANYLESQPDIDLGSVAYTLAVGRKGFEKRRVVVAYDRAGAIAALRRLTLAGDEHLLPEPVSHWLRGGEFDWAALFPAGYGYRRVPLPTYPFERQNYLIEPLRMDSVLPEVNGQEDDQYQPSVRFLLPSWKRVGWSRGVLTEKDTLGDCLVFADALGIGDQLAAELRALGKRVVVVRVGECWQRVSADEFQLCPENREDYAALFAGLPQLPQMIFHGWTLNNREIEREIEVDYQAVVQGQQLGFYSLVYLAQVLTGEAQVDLLVYTNHLQQVTGDDPVDPAKATLLGLTRVWPQEVAGVRCKVADVGRVRPDVVGRLLAEAAGDWHIGSVAYRGAACWRPTFVELEEAVDERVIMGAADVCLVTGGLGGLGFLLAEQLAESVDGIRLALLSRSVTGKQEQVARLQKLGADVLLLEADVSNRQEMQRAIDTIGAKWGGVTGVIHAAGVAGGGLIEVKQMADVEAEFAAPIYGTVCLWELLSPEQLKFFALCSSHVAFLGGAGQIAYCAANLFQDAFANCVGRFSRSKIISINWDRWQQTGMAIGVEKRLAALNKSMLTRGLTGAEGKRAFAQVLLQVDAPQVIVSTADFAQMVTQTGRYQLGHVDGFVEKDAESRWGRHPRPNLEEPYVSPRNPLEAVLCEVWQAALGLEQVGVCDNYFELGGDSLIALTLIDRLNKQLDVTLKLNVIYDRPTVVELADYVQTLQWLAHKPAEDGEIDSDKEMEEGVL